MYTTRELRHIHRSFGHPTVRATMNLLHRTSPDTLEKGTRLTLKRIEDSCDTCKTASSKPLHFRLTSGAHALRLNQHVQLHTMILDGRPMIHMVDEATDFTAAKFVKKPSAASIWRAIQHMWILTYMGPLDHLSVDHRSAYLSDEMGRNMAASKIQLDEAPIENPGTIGIVERYHAPNE